ncbi:MAG: methylated-DNA--[protein]-cysteine S-methyltransferase [Deltaproteobacteria bacterium]|nr:methylated-DNA--[protein]-cysteine S-methyltransferase [Deltaproteobacteria bacterium]
MKKTLHKGILITMNQPLFYSSCASPIGRIFAAASDDGITHVCIGKVGLLKRVSSCGARLHEDRGRFAEVFELLEKYFSGHRVVFKITLDITGSAFQKNVWAEIKKIPYGMTINYGEIAARLGIPKGARAIGNACGTNPVPIIIPCHRVLKGDGSIGGYAGGVEIKKRLLEVEGIRP